MAAMKDSNRKKWNVIYNGLVSLIRKQQSELEILQDRIQLLNQSRISDANRIKQQRSQIRRLNKVREMERVVESAKARLFLSVKQTHSLTHKLVSETTESDLEDLKKWIDLLSPKCAELKEPLEKEVKKLKQDIEKLNSKKTSEVSALLKERDFVWNQYKTLETRLTDKLKKKEEEFKEADGKIRNLLAGMEELQASNKEKDDMIATLKNKMIKLEADSLTKSEEISLLSRELESIKKSKSDPVTPVLRSCMAKTGKNRITRNRNVTEKKELNSSRFAKEGSRSSKRKIGENSSIPDLPRLMTSRFKAPKVKCSPGT
ncbi:hypothetical protein DCAR_0623004 [Daucus carota subsp. sativus]|uniref:Uncharacterized protein n=1 Tax=Daucus carota subsp. sativus TaxID=79200 RepID=A0AAF1B2F2_DAUCS|nr:PREDICTED: CAP-Gly domain-containing linker protein 1 [Daucus carota subsp. sativus]WOH03605.1 hypothetical protein DCAR_0623004 [Daucus carota subsp. sativus]